MTPLMIKRKVLQEIDLIPEDKLVDTNILSMFFRGHSQVVGKFKVYLEEYAAVNLSIITYYAHA